MQSTIIIKLKFYNLFLLGKNHLWITKVWQKNIIKSYFLEVTWFVKVLNIKLRPEVFYNGAQ